MLKLHTEYTGREFNEIYKNINLYKFLNNNLTHYKFKYVVGLNEDIFPFNPTGECLEGGLYFCEESKCNLHFLQYGQKLALIKIPNDARVYVEQDKFKSNKLIIKQIINFADVDDNFWLNIVPKNYYAFKFVKIQTPSICELAVQQNCHVLQFVKNQTEEMCISAVKRWGKLLQYVHRQTESICFEAVQQNGLALKYVLNHSMPLSSSSSLSEICIAAVQENGMALKYVKKIVLSTPELSSNLPSIRTSAVKNNGFALRYVKKEYQTLELCNLALQQNGCAIKYVKESSNELRKLAIKTSNGEALRYIDDQTEELCILAMQLNGLCLQYVINQTEEMCDLAVEQNDKAVHHVRI